MGQVGLEEDRSADAANSCRKGNMHPGTLRITSHSDF